MDGQGEIIIDTESGIDPPGLSSLSSHDVRQVLRSLLRSHSIFDTKPTLPAFKRPGIHVHSLPLLHEKNDAVVSQIQRSLTHCAFLFPGNFVPFPFFLRSLRCLFASQYEQFKRAQRTAQLKSDAVHPDNTAIYRKARRRRLAFERISVTWRCVWSVR